MRNTTIQVSDYGRLPDGRMVHQYTMDNGLLQLRAISYGGIVTALQLPDAQGQRANVVLGFDRLDDYVERNPCFGIIVGRYANRIAEGSFVLDGQRHLLSRNDGSNCLHGGAKGFGHQLWQAEIEGDALCLRYRSEDGEQGFPGRLEALVRYQLQADAPCWRIDYEARCDRPCPVNLSHHDYFNLAGRGTVLEHRLQIPAKRFCAVDARLIPEAISPVADTPFDFRQPRRIADRLHEAHPQLQRARGYDHSWLLDAATDAAGLRLAARLADPASGRVMEVRTSEPALQFYAGNWLDGTLRGSGGQLYQRGDGLCLETQHNPDSPNHPACADWPDSVLRPGQVYRSRTEHHFGLQA